MGRLVLLFAILLLFDIYIFRAVRKHFSGFRKTIKIPVFFIYWLISVLLISTVIYVSNINSEIDFRTNPHINAIGAVFALSYLSKLVIFIFQAIEDSSKILAWLTKKISPSESKVYKGADAISRSVFIGRLGLIISAIPFLSILYSIIFGRYNFTVNRKTLYFDHLPKDFDGFKIVHFSDLHSGSLTGQQSEYKKAMEMMNGEQADIIVFTGDMVNNVASEAEDWIDVVSVLKAKHGKFSILGNHDYGEYNYWNSEEEKETNLKTLKNHHVKMGFRLLLNDAQIFERDGEKIALLGVENWGKGPFPKLGRLDMAMEKAGDIPFKVLLSHDPTHWDYQVLGNTDIALTLSGHTHGLQMSINIGNFSWNPVSHKYKRWKGLYTDNGQYLYVNNGLGYIYFPGRMGSSPEITVIELKCST